MTNLIDIVNLTFKDYDNLMVGLTKEMKSVTGIHKIFYGARQGGKTSAIAAVNDYYKNNFFQTWKPEMHCNRRMEELKRCGCTQCRDEYYRLERQNYYDDYRLAKPIMMAVDWAGNEPKKETLKMTIEEPKNYAVKLLVDQLKAQQTGLASKKVAIENDKAYIKSYQAAMKIKNTEKLAIETKIKELSTALKKLGHKEQGVG